jgi:hypothetical protein
MLMILPCSHPPSKIPKFRILIIYFFFRLDMVQFAYKRWYRENMDPNEKIEPPEIPVLQTVIESFFFVILP